MFSVFSLCLSLSFSLSPQKTTFTSLTEACYSAQKTYRLVLCKYLTLLRQAHTKDMVRERERKRERETKRERKGERVNEEGRESRERGWGEGGQRERDQPLVIDCVCVCVPVFRLPTRLLCDNTRISVYCHSLFCFHSLHGRPRLLKIDIHFLFT